MIEPDTIRLVVWGRLGAYAGYALHKRFGFEIGFTAGITIALLALIRHELDAVADLLALVAAR